MTDFLIGRPLEDELAGVGTPGGATSGQPLGDGIAVHLRNAILEGALKPGERLRQEKIAAEHGTSRNPVREALRQLENEGLVTLVPHSGARVARPSSAECVELYRMREVLDALAIEESVPRLSTRQVDRLTQLARLVDQSPESWLDYDRQFHLQSFAAAPMPHLLDVIEELWNRTQQYRRLLVQVLTPDDRQVISEEHHLIVVAARRGDAEYAAALQRLHLRRSRLTFERLEDAFVE
jgi:DNA-binding GntR family transcriptional regulator